MTAPDPTAGERACRYPCDCGQFHDEHCACMDGHDPQPPAAPESDARLTERQVQDVAVTIAALLAGRCDGQQAVATTVAQVERIVAERVRVVEGERDALRIDLATCERIANGIEDRAESAEAAHRALQAAVEDLADQWDRDDERDMTAGWASDRLRALLAGGEER